MTAERFEKKHKRGEINPYVFLWVALVLGFVLQSRGYLAMPPGPYYPPDAYGYLPDPRPYYEASAAAGQSVGWYYGEGAYENAYYNPEQFYYYQP